MKNYKPAVLFIVKFIVLYLVLNVLYGFYVAAHSPAADWVTIIVTKQVADILRLFHGDVMAVANPLSEKVALLMNSSTVVNVYEGCNGINVMIVFVSFLIAYRGPWRSTLRYGLAGLIIIYLMNLVRVLLLFEVAYYYPDNLYFFHKFLFTGIIFFIVFVIWYFWIKHVGKAASAKDNHA